MCGEKRKGLINCKDKFEHTFHQISKSSTALALLPKLLYPRFRRQNLWRTIRSTGRPWQLRSRTLRDRRLEHEPHVPRKIDPGVLADLGDEGVDQRPPGRFGVHGRVMAF